MRAAEFTATLGVNTHLGSEPYNNVPQIAGMLAYLGIANVRQSSPIDGFSFNLTEALGKTGAKIDLIINGGGPVNLAGAMDNVYRLSPYLNAVENVNEAAIYPITYGGFTGIDAAVALQKDLYAAVRAAPSLDDVPVYMFSIGGADPSAFPSIGDLSAYADFANIHAYPPHGLRPIFVIHAAIAGGRTDAPSKPVVLTETGFYTLQNRVGWGGVPETLQASYLVDLVLDEAVAGVARTYLYDLIDDGPDPGLTNQEAHFGLFHVDGSPKLAATAFHNLTTILSDTGPLSRSFVPTPFSYTALGVPYDHTGNTTVIDKSDGSHVIAIWNEQQTWDTDSLTAIPVKHVPVTVDLKASYATVLVFDPMVGTTPVQTLHDVRQFDLDLVDHPLLVQVLAPIPAVPPPPAPPIVPPTPPLSPPTIPARHTAVLALSEPEDPTQPPAAAPDPSTPPRPTGIEIPAAVAAVNGSPLADNDAAMTDAIFNAGLGTPQITLAAAPPDTTLAAPAPTAIPAAPQPDRLSFRSSLADLWGGAEQDPFAFRARNIVARIADFLAANADAPHVDGTLGGLMRHSTAGGAAILELGGNPHRDILAATAA